MKHVIVGTAGHIDHGKSSLVRALTGTDPDRWEEEKRRGITIDIGFATLDLPGDIRLGFVDVPGHERFVKNMLAGISGIDVLLFVIAADESVQPQTREHFDICRLLEVRRGIVVLTKCDMVDRDVLDLVKLEVEEFVAGSFLDGAPVLAISSKTGEGLDKLKEELHRIASEVPAKDATRFFRLPIDRSFVMKGFGPVVTGTLISGQVKKEAEVEVHPTGKRLRIRGIQVHSRATDAASAGQRTALNIAGVGGNIESSELIRGMQLAEAGRFQSTKRVDCLLHVLNSGNAIKNGTQVHFHAGTAEVVAKAVLLESPSDTNKRVEPGKSGYVQFRLRDPILLLPGDRFIIRQISPLITIGGGRVLDNWVGRPMTRAQGLLRLPTAEEKKTFLDTLNSGTPEKVLESILNTSAGGCLNESEIIARTGWLPSEIRQANSVLSGQGRVNVLANSPLLIAQSERFAKFTESVVKALEQFHRQNPLLSGMSKEALRAQIFVRAHPALADAVLKTLGDDKKIVFAGEAVRLASHKIVLRDDEEQAKGQIASAFQGAGLTVPSVKEVLSKLPLEPRRAEKILSMLLQEKTLVKVSDELVFHTDAIAKLRQVLATYKAKSNKINVATFKDLTQVSRKYAIPLLEYLDKERVTRRAGDERILL